jgi:hypothetical protein
MANVRAQKTTLPASSSAHGPAVDKAKKEIMESYVMEGENEKDKKKKISAGYFPSAGLT